MQDKKVGNVSKFFNQELTAIADKLLTIKSWFCVNKQYLFFVSKLVNVTKRIEGF